MATTPRSSLKHIKIIFKNANKDKELSVWYKVNPAVHNTRHKLLVALLGLTITSYYFAGSICHCLDIAG